MFFSLFTSLWVLSYYLPISLISMPLTLKATASHFPPISLLGSRSKTYQRCKLNSHHFPLQKQSKNMILKATAGIGQHICKSRNRRMFQIKQSQKTMIYSKLRKAKKMSSKIPVLHKIMPYNWWNKNISRQALTKVMHSNLTINIEVTTWSEKKVTVTHKKKVNNGRINREDQD